MLYGGEVNFKRSSQADLAETPDKPAVAFYNAVNRGQPQAGSLAKLLGGEKRFKKFFPGFRGPFRSRCRRRSTGRTGPV